MAEFYSRTKYQPVRARQTGKGHADAARVEHSSGTNLAVELDVQVAAHDDVRLGDFNNRQKPVFGGTGGEYLVLMAGCTVAEEDGSEAVDLKALRHRPACDLFKGLGGQILGKPGHDLTLTLMYFGFFASTHVEEIDFAVAADRHHRDTAGEEDIDAFPAHRSGDDVASEGDRIDLFGSYFGKHRFQSGQVAVDIVEAGDSFQRIDVPVWGHFLCLRRYLGPMRLVLILCTLLIALPAMCGGIQGGRENPKAEIANLERSFEGHLGVFAIDTQTGKALSYNADRRFAFCSTFKVMLVAAVLKRSESEPWLLDDLIRYSQAMLLPFSPITSEHVGTGMRVSELCVAALQHSDNTASNLLINIVGGPAGVTAFARSIGDGQFRLDRIEPSLNDAVPGDIRDTTTPRAMALSLKKLLLGKSLHEQERKRLTEWMVGNTTGSERIRAGVPRDWEVADKTGSGGYAVVNDIGVLWPPHGAPVVIAIYSTQNQARAKRREHIAADAAKIVAEWVEK